MKLYFAGAEGSIDVLRGSGVDRALIAFSAPEKHVRAILNAFPDVLLDSGAWAAWNSGKDIDLARYIAFIRDTRPTSYAALDVIGDHAATMRNAATMREAGLSPIVAFHYGSAYDSLRQLAHAEDYIALGGVVPLAHKTTQLRRHLDSCFAIIGECWAAGHRVKVHGFGIQQLWCLERYPWYSVDSTTWQNASRYGAVIDDTFAQRASARVTGGDRAKLRARTSLGYATHSIHNADNLAKQTLNNVRRTLELEAHATKLWAHRGISWDD